MKPRNNIDRLVHCFVLDGSTSADPYTVVFTQPQMIETIRFWVGIAMGPNPFHPQGFGQHVEWTKRLYTKPPRIGGRNYLGRRIKFADLPPDCQRMVIQDLKGGNA